MNHPATLNDVSQLICFISYTARCPRQTKNNHYFLPTIFRNIKGKKSTSVTSHPTHFKKSSGLPTLISYMIVYKTILQKSSCAGKWERSHSSKGQMANRKKGTEFYQLTEYFQKVLLLCQLLRVLKYIDA